MYKYLLIFIFAVIHPIFAEEVAPNPLTNESEELSPGVITDPFNRGITRPIEFGSIDSSNFDRIDNVRGLSDPRYYRVISLEINNAVFKPSLIDLSKKTLSAKTSGFFVPIVLDIDINLLKADAQTLLQAYADKMSVNLVINATLNQDNPGELILQYGPFKSKSIAKKHCYYLREMIREDFDISCENIYRFPTEHWSNTAAGNQAVVGLSQAGILHFMNSSMHYNPDDLIDLSLTIKTGEPLGPKGYIVTHINRYGIYLANIKGNVALIPTFSIPINDTMNDKPTSTTPDADSSTTSAPKSN